MFTADAVARMDRAVFFLDLFGEAPQFAEVLLAELTLSGIWGGVRVRFLPRLPPRNIPKKWKLSSFDAASVELDFCDIRSISVTRMSPSPICALNLAWRDETFELIISGGIDARVVAGHCFVQTISGYQRDRGAQ